MEERHLRTGIIEEHPNHIWVLAFSFHTRGNWAKANRVVMQWTAGVASAGEG